MNNIYRKGNCTKGICPIINGINLRGLKNICDNCIGKFGRLKNE